MVFHANTNHNTARVAIFISDKIDFRTKILARIKLPTIKG